MQSSITEFPTRQFPSPTWKTPTIRPDSSPRPPWGTPWAPGLYMRSSAKGKRFLWACKPPWTKPPKPGASKSSASKCKLDKNFPSLCDFIFAVSIFRCLFCHERIVDFAAIFSVWCQRCVGDFVCSNNALFHCVIGRVICRFFLGSLVCRCIHITEWFQKHIHCHMNGCNLSLFMVWHIEGWKLIWKNVKKEQSRNSLTNYIWE